jgi:uncharacterized protein DUF4240
MNEVIFWTLIEDAQKMSGGSTDNQARILFDRLIKYDPEDIYEYYKIFMDMLWRSFRADLWDAAQIIACGCSEDVFEDFRAWLIGQGKTVFEAAMNNPEILADLISVDDREEALNGRLVSVIIDAYEQKAGQEIPLVGYHKPLVLMGNFVEKEAYPHKYPQLFAKFGDCLD